MIFNFKSTILVAEIGWNFLGDIKLAKKMILVAKKNGADVVKFQIWDPNYLKDGPWDNDGRKEIYEKSYLNLDKYLKLKNFSKKNNIKCFASAFTHRGVDLLIAAKDKVIKIPSHEAYNLDLIQYSLKNFKQVIVSVGALKKNELHKLLKFRDNKKFIPLHCVSSYPLESKKCNFEKLDYLRNNYKYFGYSGHLDGIEDAVYAICNGSSIIEKHFTLNKRLPGRDNKFAILPGQLKQLKEWIHLVQDFKIKKGLGLQKNEFDIFKNYRGRWNETS